MKKNLGLLSLVLLGCSLGGLLTFRLIGSQVDSKGVLREPFFLLPLSVLLAGAGAASGLAACIILTTCVYWQLLTTCAKEPNSLTLLLASKRLVGQADQTIGN